VVVLGGGTCVILSALNGFVPHTADLKDPLGRPSALSLQVIHSASQFDQITAVVLPHQDNLGQRIQVLRTVADDLDGIVGKAGGLPPTATTVNTDTTTVDGIAGQLPPLIARVTGRADQATPVAGSLTTAIGSVATQLQDIHGNLVTVQGDLAALGPRASDIVAILGQIQAESARIKALGPALGLLGSLVNGGTVGTSGSTSGAGIASGSLLGLGL
jgi:hypothetical protein